MAWRQGNMLYRKRLPAILGVAAACYVTAELGLSLALPGTNVAAVWAPAGIGLAAVLLWGVGMWPGVALGEFLFVLRALPAGGQPGAVLLVSSILAAGGSLEVLLGSFLYRRFIGRLDPRQWRSRDPLALAVVGAVSGSVGAAIGVTALAATGFPPHQVAGPALLTWWLGDLSGMLVVTPAILAVSHLRAFPRDPRLLLTHGAYLAATGLVAYLLFDGSSPYNGALAYLIFPLVMVAAVWGGPVLTELSVAVSAAVAIYETMHLQGPFHLASLHSSLLLVQAFACVLALAGNTLAAAIAEREAREQTLRRTYRALEVLTRCNAAVVHATDEQQLLEEVCRVTVDTAGYHLTCVGYPENDEAKTVRPVAFAGPGEVYLGRLHLGWGDNEYGLGALGSAIRTGRARVAHDLPHNPDYQAWRDLVLESGFCCAAAVPLLSHGTMYGGIVFFTREPNAFGPLEMQLLAEVGANLAYGIQTLRTRKQREEAQEEVVRRNRELAALASIFRTTTARVELRTLLAETLRGALQLTGLDGGALCMISNGCLKLSAGIDASGELISDLSAKEINAADCLCGKVAHTGEPLILQDKACGSLPAACESARNGGTRFCAAFPLKSRQRVLGVLCVFSRTDSKPDQRQLDLLQDACGPLALAIDNALLYEQVQRHAAELEQRVQQRTAELQQEMARHELAQRSLGESERKYRELVENANSIILRLDTGGRITFLNEFGQRFFGYQEEELRGRNVIGTIVPATETGGRDLRQLMEDVAAHPDRHTSNENENVRHDGTRAWISWTNRPIQEGDGRLVGCLSVGNDITALKQAEAQLEKAKEAAESADRLKSAFLATMSHELRTPLNSIIGFTGILLQELPGPLNGEQRTQLEMVRVAARHLLALITDVLDISKIEAGQLEIHRSRFDLPAAIGNVIQTMTPLARKKHLELVCDVAPDVREFTGDERRVQQILLNLLSNAVKFTDRGQVGLRCTREPGWVVLSVHDTGCGIAEADRYTLFRPFRQLDTGLTRKHEGTGLGLAICKRLVDMMGGRIELASEVGKGSVFTVRLPEQ